MLRTFPAPHQRRRQLRRISGAHAVCIGEIRCERPDLLSWEYFIPGDAKLREQCDRCDAFISREVSLPKESGEGAPRFQWRASPHDHALQFATQAAALCGGRL